MEIPGAKKEINIEAIRILLWLQECCFSQTIIVYCCKEACFELVKVEIMKQIDVAENLGAHYLF